VPPSSSGTSSNFKNNNINNNNNSSMAQNSLMSPGKTNMFKIILVFDKKFKFLEKQIMKIKKTDVILK
jgi:hypothetical protein